MWATTGIGYNVDKVKAVLGENAPVDSWNLILKPENLEKLKSCGVSFLDAPEEVFATVLNYLCLLYTSQTQPGQSAQDIAREVARQLDERERRLKAKARSNYSDQGGYDA